MSNLSVWMPPGGAERLAPGWRLAPIMRKEHLGLIQAAGRPFGGLVKGPLARIFLSPGEIYDPQGPGPDYWRFGTALRAAGFRAGDVVLNCFNYH
ncbi:MAG TPA: hypothetical protein VK464_00145, partial [Symbiobacteriaceae bacterium]|nr:hypothetical protein [Symbiobacteriaceae bacterium]